MSGVRFLYVAAPAEAARPIAEALVAEKLAACVNIIPGMVSVYRWEGKTCRAEEVVLIVKTSEEAAAAARDRILVLHPYETPAIAALAVDRSASSAAFCDWIVETSRPAERDS